MISNLFKNLILMVALLISYNTLASDIIFLNCYSSVYPANINLEIDKNDLGYNILEVYNPNTRYYSRLYLRDTSFGCFPNSKCYEGYDFNYYFKVSLLRDVFDNNFQYSHTLITLEVRNQRNNRYRRDLVGCRIL